MFTTSLQDVWHWHIQQFCLHFIYFQLTPMVQIHFLCLYIPAKLVFFFFFTFIAVSNIQFCISIISILYICINWYHSALTCSTSYHSLYPTYLDQFLTDRSYWYILTGKGGNTDVFWLGACFHICCLQDTFLLPYTNEQTLHILRQVSKSAGHPTKNCSCGQPLASLDVLQKSPCVI